MSKTVFINLVSLLLLLVLSMAHISFVADRVPPELATAINLILVPIVLGALSHFLVRGPFYVAVLVLAVLPVAHVIYLGGDASKPGLERFVALVEFVFLLVGLTTAYLCRRYLYSSRGETTH
jgi:hypothetical protein